MSELANRNQLMDEYSSFLNRMRDEDGSIKSTLAVAAASAAIGGVIVGAIMLRGNNGGQEIQEQETKALGTVTEIYAVDLKCDARSTIEVGVETRSKLELPGWLKPVLPDSVAGSGFHASVRDETGKEGTRGTYDQLTCVEGSKMTEVTDLDAKTRKVTINTDGFVLHTRKVADETTVVYESPLLSATGELLSKAGFIGSLGLVEKTEKYIEETKAKVGAAAEQIAENHAEEVCAANAFEATKKIFEVSVIERAEREGFIMTPADITWIGSNPTFEGPYENDGKNGSFKFESEKFAASECEVDPNLLDKIDELHTTKITDIKSDKQAEITSNAQGEKS